MRHRGRPQSALWSSRSVSRSILKVGDRRVVVVPESIDDDETAPMR